MASANGKPYTAFNEDVPMFSTLTLATALFLPGAPAPKDAPPAPATAEATTGLPPRIVELKPEKDGKVRLQVARPMKGQAQGIAIAIGGPNGAQNIVINGAAPVMEAVELADLKDLKVMTAGGKEIAKDDAIKALTKGGVVIISADGKKVSPVFLKAFKDDILVLVSPDLAAGAGPNIQFGQGGLGIAAPVIPVVPPQPIPAPEEK
jgi:hypothetical protein